MRHLVVGWFLSVVVAFACRDEADPAGDAGAAGAAGASGGEAEADAAGSGGMAQMPAAGGGEFGGAESTSGGEPACSGTDCLVETECSDEEDTACFAMEQVCVEGGADCAAPDAVATCEAADALPDRQAMGPILGAHSFMSRDVGSDAQCELGVGASLLPAGATVAYVLRLQFSDPEGDGLTRPFGSDLKEKIQIASNAPDILDHVYASGLEGGGTKGYFNIVLCLEEEYAVGTPTVAVKIPDAADHMSNAACITYEGGMNGLRP